jgi:cellulose synthase/poly-beta-1,6-N-acetylglucosamine synthase-like glycosyltransferase
VSDLNLFLFSAAASMLVYTYAGYPALLCLMGLVKRVRPTVRDDYIPAVSVLLAARNEAKDIGWKLAETLTWDYPADKLEILVASDASEDETDEIVCKIGDPRVTLIRMERRGGKGRALNCLEQRARGEVLFFTDANAHIPPHCIRKMVRKLADERVGCVTGGTYYGQDGDDAIISSGSGSYFSYESLVNRLEDRLGSVLACDGAIFCMRRSLYKPVLPELANDLELPLRIRQAGHWTVFEPEAMVIERETESFRQEFARRRRIAAQGALAFWKLRATFGAWRGWQLLSHKILRYLTPVPLLLVFLSSALLSNQPMFAALLGLQLAFYSLALWGFASTLQRKTAGRLLSLPFYVVFGSLGSFVGIMDACRGRRFDVWEIATLSRGQGELSR